MVRSAPWQIMPLEALRGTNHVLVVDSDVWIPPLENLDGVPPLENLDGVPPLENLDGERREPPCVLV